MIDPRCVTAQNHLGAESPKPDRPQSDRGTSVIKTDPPALAAARRRRVAALWRRFCATAGWHAIAAKELPPDRALAIMRNHLRHCGLPGFQIQSAIEAADFGLEHFDPRPAEPTGAAPGTAAKVAVLAARAARGEELWHAEDRLEYDR